MRPTTDAQADSNVIKLSFNQDYDPNAIAHDVAHPASKNFVDDDPLVDLLHEFDDLIEEIDQNEEYIFHHQKPWDYQVSFSDDSRFMADKILDQIKRLKDDAKRLRYYLDEMNID